MLSKKVILIGVALLSSCGKQSDDLDVSNRELEVRAARLSLPERYQLYQQVFDRDRPPNVVLAERVADLGGPAFALALQKARQGKANEVSAAIEVIGIYVEKKGQGCKLTDIAGIDANIREEFHNDKTAKLVGQRLAVACSKKE